MQPGSEHHQLPNTAMRRNPESCRPAGRAFACDAAGPGSPAAPVMIWPRPGRRTEKARRRRVIYRRRHIHWGGVVARRRWPVIARAVSISVISRTRVIARMRLGRRRGQGQAKGGQDGRGESGEETHWFRISFCSCSLALDLRQKLGGVGALPRNFLSKLRRCLCCRTGSVRVF